MKKLVALVALVCLPSCGLFENVTPKDVARKANNAAIVLCEAFGEENPEILSGASVSDYCAVFENLQPFIRQITAAKQELKAGFSRAE